MIYLMLFMLLMICIIMSRHPTSRYSIAISIEFISIAFFLISLMLVTLLLSNYTYTTSFEYAIYRFSTQLPISYFDIGTIFNLSAGIFLIASFSLSVSDSIAYWDKTRIIKQLIYSTAVLISFFGFNSPNFTEYMYIAHALGINKHFYDTVWSLISAVIQLLTILGVVMPIINITRGLRETKIFMKQSFGLITLTLQIILDAVFLILVFFTPLSNFYNNYDLYEFNHGSRFLQMQLGIWQMFIVFLAALAIIVFGINFNEKAFYPQQHIKKKMPPAAEDIRHIFHSYKNILFTTDLLVDDAISKYGSEDGLKSLQSIKKKNAAHFQKICHLLDIYNKTSLQFDSCDILQCINHAISQSTVAPDIKVKLIDDTLTSDFFGEQVLLEEVLINLLNNASDAITRKQEQNGLITITVWHEYKWLNVSIRDNGVGISKKNKRRIFKPFYSTKQTFNNWGIGLCYAKNIVTAHGGYICFKSKPNVFTEFQISLPIDL